MPTTFTTHYLCLSSRGCQTPFVSTASRSLPSLLATLGPQESFYLNYLHRTCPHHVHWLAQRPGLEPKVSRTKGAGRIRTQTVGLHSPCSPCILFCFSCPLPACSLFKSPLEGPQRTECCTNPHVDLWILTEPMKSSVT